MVKVNKATFTPDSRPTYDQCRPILMAWSVITRSDWRAYLSPINTRCICAVSLMHPRSNPALPDLPQCFQLTNPRSAWPTPTYSWYNYAQCLISTPGLKWIIQANVLPTDSLMRVQYLKCAFGPYILLIKSDLKLCIHLSRSLFLYLQKLCFKAKIVHNYVTYIRKQIEKNIGVQCKKRLEFLKVVDVIQDF